VGGLGKPFILGAGSYTKGNRARLQLLGVDSGKEEIVNRLRVLKLGPGYCHFPKLANGEPARGYDDEYFKGLTAERRIVKPKHGFRTYIWIKRLSQRNEPFDCRNYALAAVAMPWSGIRLEDMARDLWMIGEKKLEQHFGAQKQTMIDQSGVPHAAVIGKNKFGAQNKPIM
jgi:phage terminase large subunit GpA-like protein